MKSFPPVLTVAGRPTVRLRILTPADWRIEYDLSRVEDVPTWTMYPPHLTESAARARATANVERADGGIAVRYVVEEGDTVVGTAGFGLRRGQEFEVFYALLPAGRGRGLATDAVLTLVGWLEDTGERRVWLNTLDGNTSSENVARRASFVRVGAGVHIDGRTLGEWRRDFDDPE